MLLLLNEALSELEKDAENSLKSDDKDSKKSWAKEGLGLNFPRGKCFPELTKR
jgi:hypothetical protein